MYSTSQWFNWLFQPPFSQCSLLLLQFCYQKFSMICTKCEERLHCETSTPTEILYITKTRKIKNSPRPPSVSLFFRSSLQVVVRLVMYCWCIKLYSFDNWFFFFPVIIRLRPKHFLLRWTSYWWRRTPWMVLILFAKTLINNCFLLRKSPFMETCCDR